MSAGDRRWLIVVGILIGALAWRGRASRRPGQAGRLTGFSPERMATLEQRAWQAYYERRWPTLFVLLLRITSGQFGVPVWRAIYPTFLATRAQVIFARHGAADARAERDMRRFYETVRRATGGRYDPAGAAAAELRWWVVHRQRAELPDIGPLVDALADLYAELYGVERRVVRAAAEHRARAMDISDRWVRAGIQPASPLLGHVRAELLASYRALKAAVIPSGQQLAVVPSRG